MTVSNFEHKCIMFVFNPIINGRYWFLCIQPLPLHNDSIKFLRARRKIAHYFVPVFSYLGK